MCDVVGVAETIRVPSFLNLIQEVLALKLLEMFFQSHLGTKFTMHYPITSSGLIHQSEGSSSTASNSSQCYLTSC